RQARAGALRARRRGRGDRARGVPARRAQARGEDALHQARRRGDLMANETTSLDDAALVRTLAQRQHALVRARFAHSMNRLENTASLRAIRKDIARLRTEIRRRELAAGLPKDGLLRANPVDARTLESASAGKAEGGLLAGVVDKLSE